MADYYYAYVTTVIPDGKGGYVAAYDSGDADPGYHYTDGDPGSQTFTIGETLQVIGPDGAVYGPFTYVGHSGNGMIVTDGSADSYYGFQSFTAGQAVPVQQEAFAVCFLPGTLIATPQGARPVEALTEGDPVLTVEGDVRPVRWMWRQSVVRVFADPLRGLPVTVKAGALGEGLPLRDLHVSPDHALLVDGMLVHAGALVNGTSVVRMADVPERFTYHHIELADHALILAEGVAAETDLDNVSRRRFDNWAEYEAAFGNVEPAEPLPLPRATSRRALPAATRRRLDGVGADERIAVAA